MYKKWLFSALATSLLAAGICGCGQSESQESSAAGTDVSEESQTEAAGTEENGEASDLAQTDTASSQTGDYNVTWDDIEDVNVYYCSMGAASTGVQAVADEINKITEEYNIHVNLTQMDIGSYEQQVSLMMSSSEPVDLLITLPGGPCSFSAMTAQGQLMDITDLMEEYAPRTLEGIGDYMKGTVVNGDIYGVTCYQNFSSGIYIYMRTDVLEDLGMLEKAQNMTSFTEFEEILEAVKNSDQWGHLSGVGCKISALQTAYLDADNFADCTYADGLGDTQFMVAVDPTGEDTTVKLNYETEGYKKTFERFKSWCEKGYMYEDVGISAEMAGELVKSNVVFAYLVNSNNSPTSLASASVSCGTDMTAVKIMDMPISTASLTKFTWAVPTNSQAPEAAVTFLEMMFADSRIANLMTWGIEGVDYEIGEDGVAHYIPGNENPAYHGADYMAVNKFAVTPWEGSPANLNEIEEATMAAAPISPYLGFACDTSAVSTEIGMVTNIINEYDSQVGTGMADEAIYNEFIEKLKSSGADKIIAEYQAQLNEWLAQ